MAQVPDKKSEKSLKDAQMPPLPFAHQIKEGESSGPKKEMTLKEALEKINEMQKFCDDVENKLEEFYHMSGTSPQYLESYINNPNNFTADEFERINKERKALMAKIMLPEDIQKEEEKAKKTPKTMQEEVDNPKSAKERRKKGAGVRRNWIPMR